MKNAHSFGDPEVTNVGGGMSEYVADGKTGKPPNDGGNRTVDTGHRALIRSIVRELPAWIPEETI